MGYTTEFTGQLNFTGTVTPSVLMELTKYLSHDRRQIGYEGDGIYEGGKYGSYWYHFDWELTQDFAGIQWNGAEKAYDMEHIANWLIDKMREKFPDFGLTGELKAQGEDFEDRWLLKIVNGRAVREQLAIVGNIVTCPYCDQKFELTGEKK